MTERKDTEKVIEARLVRECKKAGVLTYKMTSPYYTGMPDRLILPGNGRALFAEIKTKGRKPRPRQQHVIADLEQRGYSVFVIDTDDKLTDLLNMIKML